MGASEKYVESSISTQERGKLVVMLYEGAIKFLSVARQKLEEEDYVAKGIYIGKAQDIIAELNSSLDMTKDLQIAQDLRSLYNFLYGHLNEANIQRDPVKISECTGILGELMEAWREVAEGRGSAASGEVSVAEGGFQA
jgi:flagellar protein FliS